MNPNNNGGGKSPKAMLLWAIVLVVGLVLMNQMMSNSKASPTGTMSESVLISTIDHQPKSITELKFQGDTVQVVRSGGVDNVQLSSDLDVNTVKQHAQDKGVAYENEAAASGGMGSILLSLLINFGPMILIFFLLTRMMSGMGGNAAAQKILQSKAKVASTGNVYFKDVIGQDEAKRDLKEIVDILKDPRAAQANGVDIPTGILLEGPPGTGKTLLARAAASEAGVPFLTISGSEFVEMFVGVGAKRVRELFEQAKASKKAIIFIDEIDAVGRKRGSGLGGGHDEREQTLNQLLTEMDGFSHKGDNSTCIIVIAATNRADVLDPALLRPGRFTRRVTVESPTPSDREKLFQYYLDKASKKVKLGEGVNLRTLANITTGMSGADVANVVNEALVQRWRRIQDGSTVQELLDADFDKAISKIKYGAEKKSLVLTADDKKKTAVHEGGHGTVAWALLGPDAVRKATVIPTGRALGYFEWLFDGTKTNYTRQDCLDIITIAVAGRASQEHFLGGDQRDSGVASDYQQAWSLARRMVAEWGMSDMGIIHAPIQEQQFLGGMTATDSISDSLRAKIEDQCREIIGVCEKRAAAIIDEHADRMQAFFDALLEKETLLGDEIRAILAGN